MHAKRADYLSENEYHLRALKITNNTVKLGIACALGVGILAICSKINVNVSVRANDFSEDESEKGALNERKRIVDSLRVSSYSDDQIATLLNVSLEDIESLTE